MGKVITLLGDVARRGGTVASRRAGGLAVLVCAAFLVAVHQRVLTYVCGNDPMLYIRAARVLLHPQLYGRDEVVQALTFVAPGYPVLLAAVMAVFGALSPYWINLAILIALLPLMWMVLRRLMSANRPALLSMMLAWIMLLGGHELNAAFLFYPFREAAVLFCVYAAYALQLRAATSAHRTAWAAASAMAAIAACTFREPSVLIAVGLLLGIPWLTPDRRARLRIAGGFMLPWLILALGAVIAMRTVGYSGSSQFESTRYLPDNAVAITRMREMLGWIPASASWAGTACIVLGIARAARRSPLLLAWFLLPAVLLFVFYAYMQLHARYFLAAFLFAVVFAGYGLDGLLGWIERSAGRWRAEANLAANAASALVLATLMAHVVAHAQPWGQHVTAGEVRAWQSRVAQLEPSAGGRVRIAVEQRCRYLEDLLLSYTDAELLDPKQIHAWPAGWAPAHYFMPMNHHALYATPQWLTHKKVFAHSLMADRFNLLPVETNAAAIPRVGKGTFTLYRLTPWNSGRQEQVVPVTPGADQTLWLDWGSSEAAMEKTVHVSGETSGDILFKGLALSNGLQAIFLPAGLVREPRARLTVEGSGPLPKEPVFAVTPSTAALDLRLGRQRRFAVNRLFPDRSVTDAEELQPSAIRDSPRRLRVPIVHANTPVEIVVTLHPMKQRLDLPITLAGTHADGTPFQVPLTSVDVPLTFTAAPDETLMLQLRAEGPRKVFFDGLGLRVDKIAREMPK